TKPLQSSCFDAEVCALDGAPCNVNLNHVFLLTDLRQDVYEVPPVKSELRQEVGEEVLLLLPETLLLLPHIVPINKGDLNKTLIVVVIRHRDFISPLFADLAI
uniref:Uncharacterized protein n=1 Tax=Triticum urartu TaxID=4572 RepID=A0A8R7K1Q2_TRIUA